MSKIIYKIRRNAVEIMAYLCIAGIIVFNHRGFLSYIMLDGVIKNISFKEVFNNLVITPMLFFAFVAAFWSIGRRLIFLLSMKDTEASYYEPVLSISIGMGLLNLIFMIFGAFGIMYPISVVVILLSGIFAAIYDFCKEKFRISVIIPNKPAIRILCAIVCTALVYNLISALSPPTSWDALAYHLPIPKFYAEAHKIYFIPWFAAHQCNIGMEMLSCGALCLKNDTLAQLLSFLSEIMLIFAMFKFAKKHISETGAWLSAVLIAIMPVTIDLGGAVNNDFSAALFCFISIISLWEYVNSKKTAWLFIYASFSGLAVAAKITALIMVSWSISIIIFLFIRGKKELKIKEVFLSVIIFMICGFGVPARNYIFTKNPVFPLLNNYFKSNAMEPRIIESLKKNDRITTGIKRTPLNFLLLPYYFAAKPFRFQHEPQYFVIPAVILLVFRAFMAKRYTVLEKLFLSGVFVFVFIWFIFGRHLWRFFLPVLPFCILLTVKWWQEISSRRMRYFLGLICSLNLIPMARWNVNNNLFAVFSLPSMQSKEKSSKERYLEMSLQNYKTFEYANRKLPDNSRILLFREVRGYYLGKEYIWGDPINQSIIIYDRFKNTGELHKQIVSLGITHIIVNKRYFIIPEEYYMLSVKLMDQFFVDYCKEEYSANGVALYKIMGGKNG